MAIPADKLKAFANGAAEDTGDEGADAEMPEGEGEATAEDRFAAYRPLLEAAAPDIEMLCDDLDPDMLRAANAEGAETLPEDLDAVRGGFETLDQEFQDVTKVTFAGGLSVEEAAGLAADLVDNGLSDDPERISGWLLLVADATAEADEGDDQEEPLDGAEDPAETTDDSMDDPSADM